MRDNKYRTFIKGLLRGKTLDLGCSKNKVGDVGVDIVEHDCVDIIHDLNRYPYPFGDESFDTILMHASLEHLENTHKTLKECRRILKRNGRLVVAVPHPNSRNYLSKNHIHFFTKKTLYHYLSLYFKNVKISGWKGTSRTFLPIFLHRILGRIYPSQIIAIAERE